MNQTTRIVLTAGIISALVAATLGALLFLSRDERVVLKVFTAGSLSEPFASMPEGQDLSSIFEKSHPDVDVQVVSGGSADMIRRVTGLNQACDVLAVADYSLIPLMMINATPKAASFCIEFARNSMVIAYTNRSAHAGEISQSNWPQILRQPDVKIGMSNPNDDPCGYRTQMLLVLAELYYNDTWLYDDLILNNTNFLGVKYDAVNDTYTVGIPSTVEVTNTSKLMIRSAEVDLTSALESGAIDYLFIYQSVAERHADSGELYLELPREINLNDTAPELNYSKVRVEQFADSTSANKTKMVAGGPIVYGVTIPLNSEHPELAQEFVALLLGNAGQAVMRNAGQEPIMPAHAGYWKSEVPPSLRDLVD